MNDSDIRNQPSISSSSQASKKTITFSSNTLLIVLAFIVVAGLAFWGGTVYQRHNQGPITTTINQRNGFFGGGSFAGRGTIGTVTAISPTSITVTGSRTDTSKTYDITSSTKITNNGSTATTSSIATGDRVIVIASTTNSSDAASIVVSPNFGSFAQPGNSNTSSTNGL